MLLKAPPGLYVCISGWNWSGVVIADAGEAPLLGAPSVVFGLTASRYLPTVGSDKRLNKERPPPGPRVCIPGGYVSNKNQALCESGSVFGMVSKQ